MSPTLALALLLSAPVPDSASPKPKPAPKPSLFLQTLASFIPPTCEYSDEELAAAFKDLGHDNYGKRDRARAVLEKAGIYAMVYYQKGLTSPDAEVRARCQQGIENMVNNIQPFDFKVGNGYPSEKALAYTYQRWPIVPELDAMWYYKREGGGGGYEINRNAWTQFWYRQHYHYLQIAQSRGLNEGKNWHQYRAGFRLWLGDAIDAGVPVILLDVLVAEMFRRDKWFVRPNFNWPNLRWQVAPAFCVADDEPAYGAPVPDPMQEEPPMDPIPGAP